MTDKHIPSPTSGEENNGADDKMYARIATTGSSDTDAIEDPQDALNSPFAKRVLRKIDFWIIPLLFVTYNFNFMDKTILSSASVFGLKTSTGLEGSQYSWVSSVFYCESILESMRSIY